MWNFFVSHLEEVRRRLIVCVVVFAASCFLCYLFSHSLLEYYTQPLRRFDASELYFQKPYEAFLIHIKISVLTGFILASPVFFTQAWLFIAPGLYEREKKILLPIILISAGLFLAGIFFGFYGVIPLGLHFLLSYGSESLRPLLSADAYFSFLIGMMVAFGVLFDFPVVLLGLVRLGVLSSQTLRGMRRLVVVLIFIAAAILTPSPDPASQILLALPLIGLFEASLFFARFLEKSPSAH